MNKFKFLTSFAIFLILILFCSCAPETKISVLSYNVRVPTSEDGNDEWKFRTKELQIFLKEKKPTFAGFQEVYFQFQIDELKEAFPDYSYYSTLETGTVIFWNYDKKVVKIEAFLLPGLKRAVNCVFFENGFSFCSLHAGVYGGEEFYIKMEETAEILLNVCPVILCGDFNHLPYNVENWPKPEETYSWIELGKSPMYSMLMKNYDDVWAKREKIWGNTIKGFNPQMDDNKNLIDGRIDWILLKKESEAKNTYNTIFDPRRIETNHRLSDHLPLFSEFEINYD